MSGQGFGLHLHQPVLAADDRANRLLHPVLPARLASNPTGVRHPRRHPCQVKPMTGRLSRRVFLPLPHVKFPKRSQPLATTVAASGIVMHFFILLIHQVLVDTSRRTRVRSRIQPSDCLHDLYASECSPSRWCVASHIA